MHVLGLPYFASIKILLVLVVARVFLTRHIWFGYYVKLSVSILWEFARIDIFKGRCWNHGGRKEPNLKIRLKLWYSMKPKVFERALLAFDFKNLAIWWYSLIYRDDSYNRNQIRYMGNTGQKYDLRGTRSITKREQSLSLREPAVVSVNN